jgi:phosphate transport system permease protein
MTATIETPQPKVITKRRRSVRRSTSLSAHGEPLVWLTGGALAISLTMIVGLLALVVDRGLATFWPDALIRVETLDGRAYLGEPVVREHYVPGAEVYDTLPERLRDAARAKIAAQGGSSERRMLRTGNSELTGTHFTWVSDFEIARESAPEWAILVERESWGRFYGVPKSFLLGDAVVANEPEGAWREFERVHDECRERLDEIRDLETDVIGGLNDEIEGRRLRLRSIELEQGKSTLRYIEVEQELQLVEAATRARFQEAEVRIRELAAENARHQLVFETADGTEARLQVANIVRAFPPNRLGIFDKLGVYFSRAAEFIFGQPREANSEGGVFPAIFGTVVMTLIMSLAVVPFGVLAALYLREYARPGFLVSTVRIAVNNLAGVPSIVFGVFGLGFFCYIIGVSIDELLFAEKLPNPTYGKGGMLWAALTLALLALPVVIVATEEALAAVPSSMREGSYACGATKWQTIRRIVLPRAMPGIMTGMILAIARGAGEVAPLMLVGAVKLAPKLAIDGTAPYLHPERSFMHLGFHIYDVGFQSQNSEAAKPMVYTTTLLLIAIIVVLNVTAIFVRSRLRRRYLSSHI